MFSQHHRTPNSRSFRLLTHIIIHKGTFRSHKLQAKKNGTSVVSPSGHSILLGGSCQNLKNIGKVWCVAWRLGLYRQSVSGQKPKNSKKQCPRGWVFMQWDIARHNHSNTNKSTRNSSPYLEWLLKNRILVCL